MENVTPNSRQYVKYGILAAAGVTALYVVVNKAQRAAAIRKAMDDPNASLAIQLHLVLKPRMSALSFLNAFGIMDSIGDSVTALMDSDNTPQARALAIATRITDYDSVAKNYKKIFGQSLENALIKRLGVDGFDSFSQAVRAKAANPYAAPTAANNTVTTARDADVHLTKPGSSSGAVLVANETTYPLPTPQDYNRAELAWHYGNVDIPNFERGEVVGYPTGNIEKGKDGAIYVQVGNTSFSPKRTWWVKRSTVASYPNHTAAYQQWQSKLSYSNPFLKK